MHDKIDPRYQYVMDKWSILDGAASNYLRQCRQIAEFVLPGRSYRYNEYEPGWAYRQKLLVDPTGITVNERVSALLHGTIMSPYTPWVRPKLMGRDADHDEQLYFDHQQKEMFKHLNSTASTFPLASYEVLQDATAFGTCYMMIVKSPLTGLPVAIALPFFQCRVSENEDGKIDTFARCFTMTLRQAAMSKRYATPKIKHKNLDDKKSGERLKFYQLIEPREGGVVGGASDNKPYKSLVICETTQEVVSELGYDEFPIAAARLMKESQEVYGRGWGHASLPLLRLLNRMRQSVLRNAEYATDPVLAVFTNRNGRLDRRPGAVNKIDPADAIFSDPRDMIQKLYEGGDPRITVDMVREIVTQVETINYVDWQSLPERSNVTATEVLDRRRSRLTQMTPVVSRLESELLQPVAERFFSLMQEQNMFLPPDAIKPGLGEKLHNEEIDFEFVSPMAQAQQSAIVESAANLLEMTVAAAQLDPSAVDVVDVKSLLRRAALAAGAMAEDLRSEREVIEIEQERDRQAAQQAEIEQAALGAQALRDGAQGAASLGLGNNGDVNREAA